MVAKNKDGVSVAVPGLILKDKTSIRRFVRSISRKEETQMRFNRFKESEFILEDHLATLKEYSVKVEL